MHRPIQRIGALKSRPILGGTPSSIYADLVFGTHRRAVKEDKPSNAAGAQVREAAPSERRLPS